MKRMNKSSMENASIINFGKMNKRGQEMTLGTIIAIVLGIAVLVFLIFGFTSGWGNLWERVTAFGGGDNNVDTVAQACALRCSTGDTYGYCTANQTLRIKDQEPRMEPCKDLAGEYSIESCPSITC